MMYEPRMWVGDEAKRECHVHLLLTCIDFVCDLLFKHMVVAVYNNVP